MTFERGQELSRQHEKQITNDKRAFQNVFAGGKEVEVKHNF